MLLIPYFQNRSHFYTAFVAVAKAVKVAKMNIRMLSWKQSGVGRGTEAVSGSAEDHDGEGRSQETHVPTTHGCTACLPKTVL